MSGPQATFDHPAVDDLAPAELQAAARAAYVEAAANGHPPTGAQLGEQFSRSARWGRDRIAEAKATTVTHASPAGPPIGSGGDPGAAGPATPGTAMASDAGGAAHASPGGPPSRPSHRLVPAGAVEADTRRALGIDDGTHASPGGGHGLNRHATAAGAAQDGSGIAAVRNEPPSSQRALPGGSGNGSVDATVAAAATGRSNGSDDRPAAAMPGPRSVAGSHGDGSGSVADHPIDDNGRRPACLVVPTSSGTELGDRGSTGNGSHEIASHLSSADLAAATDTARERGSRQAAAEALEDPSGYGAAAAHVQSTARGTSVAAATVITPSNGSGPSAARAEGGSAPTPAGTWSRRIIRWVTTIAVIVVAGCAARSSYEHQRTVVEMAGEHRSAWYMPLSVDGMMLIASLNMLVRRWDGQRAGWLTWTALLLGGAASLAANIAAAEPTLIGRVVAGWSPVCLIVSYELLMQQLPNRTTATTEPRR